MEVLFDILINVTANLIFWMGLGLVAAAYVRTSQRRFRRFFGLVENARLSACVSNLWSTAVSSRPRGYTVSLHELRASESINRLFGTASFRLPDMVRGLVDTIYLGGQSYNFHTTVSPTPSDGTATFQDFASNLIVIGAASKNCIRHDYVTRSLVQIRLSNETADRRTHQIPPEQRYAEVVGGPEAGRKVRSDSLTVALVERIYDPDRAITVFFCLGQRGDSTWAATEYLVRNWRSLEREFGSNTFSLCLGFRDPQYSYEYAAPVRLYPST